MVVTFQRFFILNLSLVVINSVDWTFDNEQPFILELIYPTQNDKSQGTLVYILFYQIDQFSLEDDRESKELWLLKLTSEADKNIQILFESLKGHFEFDLENYLFYCLDSNYQLYQYSLTSSWTNQQSTSLHVKLKNYTENHLEFKL